jgi:hypothetical protein
VPEGLEVERDTACAAADIKAPATRVENRPPLMRRPRLEWSEICRRPIRRTKPTVVALDHLTRWDAMKVVLDKATICILLS